LVELAAIGADGDVAQATLTGLGLRDALLGAAASADPADGLIAAIREREALLILDNCEHVIEAAAKFADRVLGECRRLRILATSREPLGITGEALWLVEPLAVPTDAGLAEIASSPAVRLLRDRAGAVRKDLGVDEHALSTMVRVCRALDGMPLAIELAAARSRALTPGQLAARLDDRFRLLTMGSRTALPRHQTLRAVVEWSWELLDEPERVLWRRLSIFAGGATVESAEAICAGDLDVLASLVDKSLVVATEDGRYRMLETIRAYGMECLAEAGEEDLVRRAHAEYFVRMAEEAESRLRGGHQVRTLAALTAEHDNLHAALRWAIAAGDTPLAIRLVAALGWYWWLCGHRAEGNELAAEALALPDIAEDQTTAIACTLSAFTSFGGPRDMEEVTGWMRRARDITERIEDEVIHPVLRLLGPMIDLFQAGMDDEALHKLEPLLEEPDPWLRAMAHFMYGQVLINMGHTVDAESYLAKALAGFHSLGDHWGSSFALASQAEMVSWRGDYRRAIEMYEEALAHLTGLGTTEESPMIYMRLANALWLLGEKARAGEFVAAGARVAERSLAPEGMATVHHQLGEFARREGRLTEARAHLDRGLALAAEMSGPPQFKAMMMSVRAYIEAADGDLDSARAGHADALRQAVASSDAPITAQTIIGFADLAVRREDYAEAVWLAGAAEGIRGLPDLSLIEEVEIRRRCRAELGEGEYTAGLERGRTASTDDVLAHLGIDRPPAWGIFDADDHAATPGRK
jgi:predicted ATPase